MWKHVLPPVVLVIAFWLVLSLTTTAYISYADHVRQRIFRENLNSIKAASDMQIACWRVIAANIAAAATADELEMLTAPRRAEMTDAVALMRTSAITERDHKLVHEIEINLAAMDTALAGLDRARVNGENLDMPERDAQLLETAVARIAEASQNLRTHNRQLIDTEEAKQRVLLGRMMLVRNLTLILGPIAGIVLGWRLTSRLQQSVSTLAITLRGAASNKVYTVGEYSLRGAADLKEVQELSDSVIDQMQKIGRELEKAELEIIQAERLAAVGELAAGVAHELRNPLTSVKLLLQHAANAEDEGTVTVSNMQLILKEVSRMEETIQGLLDFSRPADLCCRIHDLRAPLQRAITLVSGRATSSNVRINLTMDQEPLWVNGDIDQLHQIFVNLLINAVESISSGGSINVEATRLTPQSVVSVSIRDNGSGIPEELMYRLFEPFVTTKERGTGLGLALCHRIVTNHHGTVTAANHPQGGAVFCVEFPSASAVDLQARIA